MRHAPNKRDGMRSLAAVAFGCAMLFASPGVSTALAQQPDDGTQFKAYVLHQTDAEAARQQLAQFFASTPGVETVADAPRNRVLVRGNAQVLALADQFIAKLDQPAVTGPGAATAVAPQQQLEAYPLTPASREVLAALQTQAAGRTDVRVAMDPRTSQALVLAPAAIHAQVRTQLAQAMAPTASQPIQPPASNSITLNNMAPPVAAPAGAGASGATFQLHHLPADQLRERLEQLLSRPLAASTDVSGQWQSFLVEAAPGASVTVSLNPATSELRLAGPPTRAAAWRTVIEAMDSGPSTPGAVTRLVSTKPASQDRVRQVLQVVQSQAAEKPHGAEALVSMMLQPRDSASGLLAAAPPVVPPASAPAQPAPAKSAAERAFAEPQPAAEAAAAASSTDASNAAKAIDLANAAGELLGPVQIEFVEGLDVIVLRGNERDVQRVMEIINQIEQLSAVTVPTIEVYQLQNVDSRALGALLTRLYQQVLSQRIGDVSITPLGKPNALLLVGRAENVRMAKDLIQQLDQPVSPATRFEVFPLKHASADDAKKLIDSFLQQNQPAQGATPGPATQEAPTLAARAMVVADYRTNSLIVSAGPRDIAEIAALVVRIDAPSGEAVDQVRVFQLKNAVASDLASVLRDAIQGQGGDTSLNQNNGGNNGGQGGNSGGGSSSSGGRASSLEFRQIGAGAQQALTSGVLTGARISADTRANSIIVTAPADSMELIAALIDQLDQAPNAAAELKVFTIVNGDATSLTDMLRTLFNASQNQQQTNETGGLGEGGLVRMQFSVDQRTNSIIAAGTKDDLAVVEAILLRLDLGDVRERVTTVYKLKNAFANDVATALNNWLQTERTAEQNAQLAISPFEQIDREVIIVPELASNSLVVSATPRYYKDVKDLIEQLDERPPMVLIQVMIAEVQLNNTDEFGIQLGLQDSVLFDRSLLSDVITNTSTTTQTAASTVSNTQVISATQNPGFNFNNQPLGNNGSTSALANAAKVGVQGLSDFSLGRVNNDLGFGGFVFSASSNSVNILLRALQEKRRLEVLSRPQIMALDGQTGLVQVGQRVPRITATSLTQFGQTNSIVYEPVGIILQVTPRISPDGLVVMQIGAEKSEVGAEAEGIPISVSASGQIVRAPRIDATTAFTTVSALSDQTVVLSGLLTSRQFDIHRQVPLLGDIPLIGDLFRYDSVNKQRTELLIILTPKIVYNKLDSDVQKQIESSRMSWCISDVVKLHGDAGLRSRCDQWNDNETEAVYPTYIPKEGELLPAAPEQAVPTQGPSLQAPPRPSPPNQLPPGNGRPMPIPPQSPMPMTYNNQIPSVVPTAYQSDSTAPQQVNQAIYTAQPTRLPPSH
jgi:general secretion pathway protein D